MEDSNFPIKEGDEFLSFEAFDSAWQTYQKESNVLFVKESCKKLTTDNTYAAVLQFDYLKYICKLGTKVRRSQSKGLRVRKSIPLKTDCKAALRIAMIHSEIHDCKVLRVKYAHLEHNHEFSEELKTTLTVSAAEATTPSASLARLSATVKRECADTPTTKVKVEAEKNDISRFPVPDRSTIPEDLRNMMDEAEEKTGFVPNVFKTLSFRPAEMRAFIDYYNAVMETREGSRITKIDKEMIIVAMSGVNRCRYCIIAHSALMRIFSKNAILADQIAANWETADIDPRQRAILEFAMDVSNCVALKENRFTALRRHGMDMHDAWDIGSVVALFSLSNRMAFLTNMAPNEEFYLMGRVPRNAML